MMLSCKDIPGPSPQDVYSVGSGLSDDYAVIPCGVPLSRGVITRGNRVSLSPSAFPSPFPEYRQSLAGFGSLGSPVVSLWDRAGPSSENGIIPITNRTFLSQVHDLPGGAGCYRMSCRHTKKNSLRLGCCTKRVAD